MHRHLGAFHVQEGAVDDAQVFHLGHGVLPEGLLRLVPRVTAAGQRDLPGWRSAVRRTIGAMDRNDAVAASSAEARRAFYERIGALGMTPLWEVLGALVPPQPTSPVAARAAGATTTVREHVMEAGRLITAEEAERRVLILENPALRGQSCITAVAVRRPAADPAGRDRAGAPPHRSRRCASCSTARAPTPRSTASARPCATATSSSRPSWTWHDHGNDGHGARWSGSTASTSRWCAFSTPASPRRARRSRRRRRGSGRRCRWRATA